MDDMNLTRLASFVGGVVGATPGDRVEQEIRNELLKVDDRVAQLEDVVLSISIHIVLAAEPDRVWTTADLGEKLMCNSSEIAYALKGIMEALGDTVFFDAVPDPDTEDGVWVQFSRERGVPNIAAEVGADDPEGLAMFLTREGRKKVATGFVDRIGVARHSKDDDARLWERSPALAMAKTFMEETERFHHQEGMLRIVNLKAPIWAGARGFNEGFQFMVARARLVKNSGKPLDEFDGLTQLCCYAGATMHSAHVMMIGAKQTSALPPMTNREQDAFARSLHLPLEPCMFLDFTSDGDLPCYESSIDKENLVGVVGCLINRWDDNLLFTPLFYYNGDGPIPLGTIVYNQKGDSHFWWNRQKFTFDQGAAALAVIAHTDVLDKHPDLAEAYRDVVQDAVGLALATLYFVESANVESVPASVLFPKRDIKRAEKRGWRIPDTVRVHRPQRRPKGEPTGNTIEYSHQFMVRGHYKHMSAPTHPHVRCQVCKGKPVKEIGCSRCNSTGLDPELVKPCSRIDITTGEKTCPHGCRKEWVPEYPKGPEDAPLVLKTYDIKAA